MAKSTRSKVKRHFRAKKRQEGVYAVTDAARLQRLNLKLRKITTMEKEGDEGADEDLMPIEGEGEGEQNDVEGADGQRQRPSGGNTHGAETDTMDLDGTDLSSSTNTSEKRISTHGPRGSRREQWRLSKGLPARPKSKGMNRQGGVAARRKSGRSQRRR